MSNNSSVEIEIVSSTPRRGGNYTKEKYIAIARAYIYLNTESIVGTYQIEGTYYK